ncbi:MAG: alpha/beta fold hydrolase [Rhizobiales bacterium]|nr:alpha/beta fold hydrolase [Hyphomicrobiales bacterium]
MKANGISINYEDRGPADAPVMLLVNGFGSTMMSWPDAFMNGLKARGYRVIRYDNRDVGKSEKLSGLPSVSDVINAMKAGKKADIPYTLADMAADGMGLLDALGVKKAHVMGVSMGGMIVQNMAINHGDRLLSATSVMSTTGNPELPPASDEAMAALTSMPPSEDREVVIRHRMAGRRTFESPAYPKSDDDLYEAVATEFDHMYYPEGSIRQYAAIIADSNRFDRLTRVNVPMLVIHGKADPLVRVDGGIDTAKAVPGARLELIEGMGHDLPHELCARMVQLIADHADAARGKAAAE